MLKIAGEIGLENRVSIAIILATISNTAASATEWINENMVSMSAAATFILTITMIFSYVLGEMRKNRSHRIETIKQELEIEKLRFELEELEKKEVKKNTKTK